jgi:hypothetical protein
MKTFDLAELYYSLHRKKVDKMFFSTTEELKPNSDLINTPSKWDAKNWRWFIKNYD